MVVTGLSGAGRSHRGEVLRGPRLLRRRQPAAGTDRTLVDLGSRSQGAVTRLGGGAGRAQPRVHLRPAPARSGTLAERGMRPRVLFLEATDEVLVRRFENVRRAHPLQGDRPARRRHRAPSGSCCAGLRDEADLVHRHRRPVTCTSCAGPVEALRRRVAGARAARHRRLVRVQVRAAGRRRPRRRRALPAQPVLDPGAARAHRAGRGGARLRAGAARTPRAFLDRYAAVLEVIGAGLRRESKRYLTVAVGCTGGKHRSVVIAEQLADRLAALRRAGARRAPGPGP